MEAEVWRQGDGVGLARISATEMWFFWCPISSSTSTLTPLDSFALLLILGVGLGRLDVEAIMAFSSSMSPDMTSHKPFSDKLTAGVEPGLGSFKIEFG